MSHMEIIFLAALSVISRRKLKPGDVKQAFIKSKLPPDKTYVVKPLTGCSRTPVDSYWLLKCVLGGLIRVPRNCFD